MNIRLSVEETEELKERIEESGLLAHEVLCHDLELEEEVVFPIYLYDSVESREEIESEGRVYREGCSVRGI